jgi:hypothetical protein|tara:strand:- start:3135 stop:3560 length:426 start_codon:yes stop_codon:yes gene_type:complete
MSTAYNIFYDSNKEIIWSSTAPVNSDITTAEAAKGYTHVELDCTDTPTAEQFYVNSDATAVSAKTIFDPTFSSTTAAVDAVITVTDIPSGTEVFLDGVSAGTMSDTTLTLTAQQAGKYTLKFSKAKYQNHTTTYIVTRYNA